MPVLLYIAFIIQHSYDMMQIFNMLCKKASISVVF